MSLMNTTGAKLAHIMQRNQSLQQLATDTEHADLTVSDWLISYCSMLIRQQVLSDMLK